MKIKSKIFNTSEEQVHVKLLDVCSKNDVHVFPKIRIADILEIENSGISNEEYSYCLKAHFDFTITDNNYKPIFVVEFDGPIHDQCKQIDRDKIKNKVCQTGNLPILRVNSRHIIKKYREYDLLSWVIDNWFMSVAFYDAQECGSIPYDEPYDPMMIITMTGKNGKFPMWLSYDIIHKLKSHMKNKEVMTGIVDHYIGIDHEQKYFGIGWLKLPNNQIIYSKAEMKCQMFPGINSELLSEILIFGTYEKFLEYKNGCAVASEINYFETILNNYKSNLQQMSLMISSCIS